MLAKFKQAGNVVIADERLYLNAARTEVLREGDPKVAYLLAAKGQPIPAPWAAKLRQDTTPEPVVVNVPAVEIEQRETRPAKIRSKR